MIWEDFRTGSSQGLGADLEGSMIFKIDESMDDFVDTQGEVLRSETENLGDNLQKYYSKKAPFDVNFLKNMPFSKIIIQFKDGFDFFGFKEYGFGMYEFMSYRLYNGDNFKSSTDTTSTAMVGLIGHSSKDNFQSSFKRAQGMIGTKNKKHSIPSFRFTCRDDGTCAVPIISSRSVISDEEEFNNTSFTNDFAFEQFKVLEKFLHLIDCKNIRTKEIKPPEKVNKKRKKRGKLPLLSHHVLEIKSSGKASTYEVKGAQNPWSNRVHLCRGHYKTYTEEKPLFGKIVGKVWFTAHVRGDRKQGMVTKEYTMGVDA